MLEHIGFKDDGVFVEVGAFDCKQWSNTYGLGKLGWKGLLFEPQEHYYNKCVELYKDEPNVEIVRSALSDWQGVTAIHIGGSVSTIDEETRDIYLDTDWAKSTGLSEGKKEMVPVSVLSLELDKRNWPPQYDLLVIDVEGSEIPVLNGTDLRKNRPKMAIIETHEKINDARLSIKAPLIDAIMGANAYDKIYADEINSIYVEKENEHGQER
jgi:FkbM family methyltransferase